MNDRSIAWLDCETTGTDPQKDRIVELAIVMQPTRDGEVPLVWRFNPDCPIPAEATAVHGITDADVAVCGRFKMRAAEVLDELRGCDLGGYNIRRFDLPLLVAEFERAGFEFSLEGRRILDLYQVHQHLHPRTLGASVQRYLGRELEGAHTALADTAVLPDLLDAMRAQHPDLPADAEGLHALCDTLGPYRTPVDDWFDMGGEVPVFRRGKHKGLSLPRVARIDRGYLGWITRTDIHQSVKALVRRYL